ncbi:geranylgeranyl reductase family protein [soil metagenome]
MPDPVTGPDPALERTGLDVEVLVVGAGPAGVAAAIELRRAGWDVVVVDKARFPRDKCCGDGLTTLALRELEHLGFRPGMVSSFQPVNGAVLRAPNGREVTVPLPGGAGLYAAVVPRIDLDAALVDLAVAAGVDVRQGHALTAVDAAGSGDRPAVVTVTLDPGGARGRLVVTARHVIAADGMWSPTRKALGLSPAGYLGEWHAMRQYVSGVTGPAATQLVVWFDEDLLPGYAWSFPLPGGRANVGFGLLRGGDTRTKEMSRMWQDVLARPHVAAALGPDAVPEGRATAWPIPARIDTASLAHGRVLFVGDAAMATDVMTGEGIGQALLTGRLAAEAIVEHGAGPTAATAYRSAIRRELVADHRMSRALGRALRHRHGADTALAVVARAGEWGRRNFARWMFEDEPRAVLVTPRRWHRHLLHRPGAFRPR